MSKKQEYEKIYISFMVMSFVIIAMNIYYYAHPMLHDFGWTHDFIDKIIISLRKDGAFSNTLITKAIALILSLLSVIVRSGKGKDVSWKIIISVIIIGATLYFIPFRNAWVYIFCTIFGYIMTVWATAMIGRKFNGFKPAVNDNRETFEQCNELIETEDSVNIPIEYQYLGKLYKGFINIVAPFRASLVMGTPGSGKSFAIYEAFIKQMLAKGYTMFCYDYKFDDLSYIVYNELRLNLENYRKKGIAAPRFCVVNFNDPRYSMRCNPMNPKFIKDPVDASEMATNILVNMSPEFREKKDFWGMSAQAYISSCIWLLKIYKNGKFCDFPHLIEIMTGDYKRIFSILVNNKFIRSRITPFVNALEGNSQEQLQSQLASAQMPLINMDSPALYWALSGNDFDLDFNNPDDPKIICMGNSPERQSMYGTVMALYAFVMFKLINQPGKKKSAVLLDELPTIFLKGLDNLIATARGRKVAIVIGAQDFSQLIRDYTEKEANVILNTIGNIFSGQVNGKTAKSISETMGKEWREEQSQTRNIDSDSVSVSYRLQELMPSSRIETLTQGHFIGKVADQFETPIDKKFFAGKVLVDLKARKERIKKYEKIPMMTDFGLEQAKAMVMADQENVIKNHCIDLIDSKNPNLEDEEKEKLVSKTMSGLSKQEKKKILDKAIDDLHIEMMNQKIEENYDQIKQDIIDMIDDLCPDYGDDEDDE